MFTRRKGCSRGGRDVQEEEVMFTRRKGCSRGGSEHEGGSEHGGGSEHEGGSLLTSSSELEKIQSRYLPRVEVFSQHALRRVLSVQRHFTAHES